MHEVPQFLNDAFQGLLREIAEVARQGGGSGYPVRRLGSSNEEYFAEFSRLARSRSVSRVVLLSDSFSEMFPDDRFLSGISGRLEHERGFEFYAFVGLLSDEQENPILSALRRSADQAVGHVEVQELGMKPLMQGLFTDNGAICRAIQLTGNRVEESYLFENIDLTGKVLSVARAYLDSEDGSGASGGEGPR